MELGAVVCRDGEYRPRLFPDQADSAPVQFLGGAGLELADQGVFCFAFDQRHNTVVVRAAHDGVYFPVADA